MAHLRRWFRAHLDGWEEICFDDSKRLRQNVLLFTFVIFVVLISMFIRDIVLHRAILSLPTLIFALGTLTLFLWQFFRREYSAVIAWLFGGMSLAMSVVFVGLNRPMETGHIWIYILPIVGTMMVPLRYTLIYNGLMMALVVGMLSPAGYALIPAEYSSYFRTVYPISLLVVTLCNYVAAYTRHRTQQQLQEVTARLRESAYTDPLTGAYNRRALTAHFGEETECAYGLSFAMMDLDHFKKVNDTYGHEAGDLLLKHLVALIRRCIPGGANLYRWGGEEFLLVLKDRNQETLEHILTEIRRLVAETPLPLPAREGREAVTLNATVSIGGMVAGEEQTLSQAIGVADMRMYQAKQSGRNRVIMDG